MEKTAESGRRFSFGWRKRSGRSSGFWLMCCCAALAFGTGPACRSKSQSGKSRAVGKGGSGGAAASREANAARKAGRPAAQAPQWHPSKTLDDVWKPGTERTFVFYGPEKNGKRLEAGRNWCRYEGLGSDPDGAKGRLVHCRVHVDAGRLGSSFGSVVESDVRLLLDEKAVPKRLWGRSNMAGAFDLRFGPKKVTIQAAGNHLQVDWPGGIPLLPNNHPVMEELLLAMVGPKAKNEIRFSLFSPSGALVIPYEARVEPVETAQGPALQIKNGMRETIVWRNGAMVSSEVGGIRIVPENRPEPKLTAMGKAALPTYHRPKDATWKDLDVVIPGRDVPIAGSLRVPDKGGPRPAVLFISGSGSQDRNGFAGVLDVGTWQILDHLARSGFVVLSTDDRGTGKTKVGRSLDLGYWDLVADADAALSFLAKRREVRRDRIFILGHSEGAVTALILAARHPKIVAGLALMAGPARNLADVIRDQMIHLSLAGLPKDKAAERLANFDKIVAALRAGKRPSKDVMTDTEWKASRRSIKWLTDHLKLRLADYVHKVRCPVLICQGAKDVQVSPDKDARRLAAMLAKAGNKDVTLKIFSGLDHLFKPEPGVSSMKSYMDAGRKVDPGFMGFLRRWLATHSK